MGPNERCSALVAVLVLLLLLDSSCAQPAKKPVHKKQKPITDPHYRHYKQYAGSSDGYGGYAQTYGYPPAYKQYADPYKQKSYKDGADYYKQYDDYYDYVYEDKYSKQYGKYDDYNNKKKKKKVLPELSATVKFSVEACSGKYPAIALSADTTNATIKPTTVAGWWRMSCKRYNKHHDDKDYDGYDDYGYEAGSRVAATAAAAAAAAGGGIADAKNASGRTASYEKFYYDGSYDAYGDEGYTKGMGGTVQDVGYCDFTGIAKTSIAYEASQSNDNIAKVTLSCFLNDDARKCHPGLAGLTDMDTVEFNTVGDLVMAYSPDTVPSFTFNIAPAPPSGFSSLVTAFFNGRAGPAGTRTDGLPLTRFNGGKVTKLAINHCKPLNGAADLPLSNMDNTGDGSFDVLFTV